MIDRFSEDIDLCLVPEFVGADANAFGALASRVKRDAAVLHMQRLCAEKTREELMPALEHAIAQLLGDAHGRPWLRYELDANAKSPIVYFRSPVTQRTGFEYLQREVKLELGTLTDQQPTGHYPVRPPWRGRAASDWYRPRKGRPPWRRTTPKCAPCSCRSRHPLPT